METWHEDFLISTDKARLNMPAIHAFLRLATKDAHGLYAQFGFELHPQPECVMKKSIVTDYRQLPDKR